MKRTKLLQHLRQHGCEGEPERTRHSMWRNPKTGQRQAIPRHREIKAGLARKICRDLSVPPPTEK
ncbi:MAG: type II toxin-antitoxin system HicA family toxin [Phycisphaeraceae bacterium]